MEWKLIGEDSLSLFEIESPFLKYAFIFIFIYERQSVGGEYVKTHTMRAESPICEGMAKLLLYVKIILNCYLVIEKLKDWRTSPP